MTAPLVTCIIPVFNGARFLSETVNSVLAQTYPAIDILVVDDGSTDDTPSAIASFGTRIRSVRQTNSGEAAARNTGVKHATGGYVAFLDADDLWEPGKLAAQVDAMQRDPGIDLCFTAFQNFWMPEVRDEHQQAPARAELPFAAWSICTVLTRRDVFDRFGPFDERLRKLPNMTWFLHAVGRGARVTVLPEALMQRRIHAQNASRLHDVLSNDEFLPMLKAWRDYRRQGAR